jgi:hypothetical protein
METAPIIETAPEVPTDLLLKVCKDNLEFNKGHGKRATGDNWANKKSFGPGPGSGGGGVGGGGVSGGFGGGFGGGAHYVC